MQHVPALGDLAGLEAEGAASARSASPGHSRGVCSTTTSPPANTRTQRMYSPRHARAVRPKHAMDPLSPPGTIADGFAVRGRRDTSVVCSPPTRRSGHLRIPPAPGTSPAAPAGARVGGSSPPGCWGLCAAGARRRARLPLRRPVARRLAVTMTRGTMTRGARHRVSAPPGAGTRRSLRRAGSGPKRRALSRPGPPVPDSVLLARDFLPRRRQMPFIPGPWQATADSVRGGLAERERPPPHGPMADHDTVGGRRLVHLPRAQGRPKVEPDGMADDFGREAAAGVARVGGHRHPAR